MTKRTRVRVSYRLPAATVQSIERLRDKLEGYDPLGRRPSQADAVRFAVAFAGRNLTHASRRALKLAVRDVDLAAGALKGALDSQTASRVATRAASALFRRSPTPQPPKRSGGRNPWAAAKKV